ncbi:MAG: hypothetical protein ACYC61_19610 [Isosphaeraceae bacterium]
MMTAHLTQWILMVALAQVPQETDLLKYAPADVDVAIRTRGLEAASKELVASIRAMDLEWGNMIEGMVAGPMSQIRDNHGEHAASSPFLIFIRLSEAQGGGPPPFAVVLPAKDYRQFLKEFSGGKDVELKPQDGGHDAFEGPVGDASWYAMKGDGVVALGTSKSLIADIAKKGGKRLDSVLTGAAAKSFLAGEVGVYLNASALTARYQDQIDQARQAMIAAMEQQAGNNAMGVQIARDFYGAAFDLLKYADVLTLNLNLDDKGFHLAGFLKVKAGSNAMKSIPTIVSGGVEKLGNLPKDATFYMYTNLDARAFDRIQGTTMRMLSHGKPSPELEKAMAALQGLGRIESAGSGSFDDSGRRSLSVIRLDDPRKFIAATIATLQATGEGEGKIYKSIKIEPAAQTYGGFTFTHVAVELDFDKLAEMVGGNPAAADSMKAMMGRERISHYWYGTDGKTLFQILAPSWDVARSLIDDYRKPGDHVGQTPGYRSARAAMPDRASLVMVLSVQGGARMYAAMFSATTKNPELKVPADMPKEPAFIGISLTPRPREGYEFHLIVPADAGPAISKGLVPVFRGLANPGANP